MTLKTPVNFTIFQNDCNRHQEKNMFKEKTSEYSAEQIADYVAKYCDYRTYFVLIDKPRYNKMTIKEALANIILNEWDNSICCNAPLIQNLDKIIQKGIFHEIYLLLSDFETQLKLVSFLICSLAFWFIRNHYDSPSAIIVLFAYTFFALFIFFYFN